MSITIKQLEQRVKGDAEEFSRKMTEADALLSRYKPVKKSVIRRFIADIEKVVDNI